VNKPWLERPRTIRLLWIVFVGILALTVIAQLVVHPHGYFGLDGSFGFNAWFGLLSCVAMILVAKALGIFLKRPDSFYDDEEAGR
jgi:hypothetical protein